MSTPFDEVVDGIKVRGFHNHRLEDHSGTVSRGILRDLRVRCEPFRQDFTEGRIREWLDFPSPGGRARKVDAEYQSMLDRICKAYMASWHL